MGRYLKIKISQLKGSSSEHRQCYPTEVGAFFLAIEVIYDHS